MRTLLTVLVLVSVPLPGVAKAQELSCPETMTFADCYNFIYQQDHPAALALGAKTETGAATLSRDVGAKVAEKVTSDSSAGAASTVRDTLAAFLADLGLGTSEEKDNTLTFRFNPDFFRLSKSQKLALTAVLRKAQPNEALVAAFPEMVRTDRKDTLSNMLSDFDDWELQLSWSPENERFGRIYRPNQMMLGEVFGLLVDQAEIRNQEKPADAKFTKLLGDYQGIISPNRDSPWSVAEKVTMMRKDAEDHRQRANKAASDEVAKPELAAAEAAEAAARKLEEGSAALQAAVVESARAWVEAQAAREELLASSNIVMLADLINNQPQLLVEASYRDRDSLVGPNSWSAKVSYEWSPVNMNSLRKALDRDASGKIRLSSLTDYLSSVRPRLSLEKAPRFKASFMVEEMGHYRVAFPDDGVSLDQDSSRKLTGSLATGLYTWLDDQGNQTGRLDLEGSYEDVSDDPMRQDRAVVTLSYGQKVSDKSTGTVSLAWASKPELLGEVNKELSAVVGLKWSLDRKEASGGS